MDLTDLRGLFVAVALHAAILGSALFAPRPAFDEGRWRPVVADIDVDLEMEPARPAAESISPEGAAPDVAAVAVPDAPFVHAPAILARPSLEAALPLLPEPSPQARPEHDGPEPRPEYDGPAPPVPIGADATPGLPRLAGVPGRTGDPAWVGAPGEQASFAKPAAPTPTIDRKVATRLLGESLAERDTKLGLTLPAAGNIAGALGSAVRTALGPGTSGSGTFMAIVAPGGRIVALTPVAWSGAPEGTWAGAAQIAAAALAGRSFSMVAPFQNGAVVWVDVTATLALPSGATSGVSGEPGGFRFDLSDIGRRRHMVVRTSVRVAAVK